MKCGGGYDDDRDGDNDKTDGNAEALWTIQRE